MGDKEKFWEEVGKKLPVDKVYDDVLHPSFSEVGNALQGAVRVALTPISAFVWVYEKNDGRKIHGEMNWKPGVSKGTIKNREEKLRVSGTYDFEWRSYKPCEDCLFKYTIVEIKKEKIYK